ncbi:TPA: TrmB family transcriptional regulator [Legionella pneumophila]|nr:TrmB family transcriptional regulator [Legionella pneumophila]
MGATEIAKKIKIGRSTVYKILNQTPYETSKQDEMA